MSKVASKLLESKWQLSFAQSFLVIQFAEQPAAELFEEATKTTMALSGIYRKRQKMESIYFYFILK